MKYFAAEVGTRKPAGMPQTIYVALENLEQRYTVMMNHAIAPYVDTVIYPNEMEDRLAYGIKFGQFLDVNMTCQFKALQLSQIAQIFDNGLVLNGCRFLIGDIWFPGVEMIRYMAELQGIDVKLYGFNYAGRADPTDFVQRLGIWADHAELAYHLLYESIFVGSMFHKDQVMTKFGHLLQPHVQENQDITVTGYIWDIDWVKDVYRPTHKPLEARQNAVIWPHRPSNEKGLESLKHLASLDDEIPYIIPSSGNFPAPDGLPGNVEYRPGLSKAEYYQLLDSSKWYLSTARQETFGYTLQEAIVYGCNILVPNRVCYPEMVPERNLMPPHAEEVIEMIRAGLDDEQTFTVPLSFTERWDGNVHDVMARVWKEV